MKKNMISYDEFLQEILKDDEELQYGLLKRYCW